jgi:hypothetical protein
MAEVLTAVIDFTVLVSAFLTEGGVSAALLQFGVCTEYVSEPVTSNAMVK